MTNNNKIETVGTIFNDIKIKNVISKMIQNKKSLLKFAYINEGAKAWDKIRNDSSFSVGNREINALREISCHFDKINISRPINFIHLGSGNGIELPVFAEIFRFGKKDAYVGVDISERLLNILIKNHSDYLSKTVDSGLFFFQTDLEVEGNIEYICKKVKTAHRAINIVAASGEGTLLSNHDVLKYIADALEKEDYAIFSIDGVSKSEIQTICSEYDKQITRDFVIHSLKYAKFVEVIKDDSGQFIPTYYDNKLQQIVISYKLLSGAEIILLRSFKPSDGSAVKKVFNENNLEIVHLVKTKDSAFGILCRKLNKT